MPDFEYELVTLRQACERLPGLHEKLIYRWARLRQLHPVRPNGRRLYPLWELEELWSDYRKIIRRFQSGAAA